MAASNVAFVGSAGPIVAAPRSLQVAAATQHMAHSPGREQTTPPRGQAPLVSVAAAGAVATTAGLSRRRRRTLQQRAAVVRRAIGSVETRRFLGGWSADTPSIGQQTRSAGEIFMSELAPHTFQIRESCSPDIIIQFSEQYSKGRGTSINNYILLDPADSGAACLVDLPEAACLDTYFPALEGKTTSVTDVLLTFFEEERMMALERLARLERPAPLRVHCAMFASIALTKLVEERGISDLVELIPVRRSGTMIKLFEGGRVLRMVLTPTPKFPEGLCAFDQHSSTLLTGKLFSSFRAVGEGDPIDEEQGIWAQLESDWQHCQDCDFFTNRTLSVMTRLTGFVYAYSAAEAARTAEMIAPLHGPVAQKWSTRLFDSYERWIEERTVCSGEAAILYGSAYGKTGAMAEAVAKGLRQAGVRPYLVNAEFTPSANVADLLAKVDGAAIGTPTLGGNVPTPVKEAMGVLLQQAQIGAGSRRGRKKAMPVGVFGSFGWSGEAVDEVHFRLKDAGFEEAFQPIRVRMTPTEEDLVTCEQAGIKLAQAITKQRLAEQRSEVKKRDALATGGDAMDAFTRIMNTACVISSVDVNGEKKYAPVLWVSQASFTPLGFTVAVPKNEEDVLDLENWTPPADYSLEKDSDTDHKFVMSVLGEGTKDLNKTFEFKEEPAPNGCPIVEDSIAYMECVVRQVLDCGDHSVAFATVGGGTLLDGDSKAAMLPAKEFLKRTAPSMAASAPAPSPSISSGAGRASGAFCGGSAVMGRTAPARSQLRATLTEPQTWTGLTPGKEYELQVQTETDIAPDTTCFRSLDWNRDRFDIEFALEKGTTYNSFLIQGEGIDSCLVDTSHEKFRDLYLTEVKSKLDFADLKYLVVSHTEPDHSGLIKDVLELAAKAGNEELVVLGSKVCIQFLQNLMNRDFNSRITKNGETVDLGGGHVLQFVAAPNLHWPDTMFTFDQSTNVLYTCDAFGMHYCTDDVYDGDAPKTLMPHYHLYYDCLMRPNAKSVMAGLKRIKDFKIGLIAPGHGPLLKNNLGDFVERYRSWSTDSLEKSVPSVLVLWVAAYGYSERLAQSFAHGVSKTGAGVAMMELRGEESATEVAEAVGENAAIVVMTPPQDARDRANQNISTVVASVKKGQLVTVCDSYGGNDEPIDTIFDRFSRQGAEMLPSLRVREQPDERTAQLFEETGTDLGQKLVNSGKQKKVKATKNDLAKALGRISSGLYIVTARRGTALSAMVASWVAPASVDPPGLTVSVAYDRAIGSLLQVGDSMVLNILEQGSSLGVIKHFLKRFPPGANRFEGVKWSEAPGCGCPVLEEACAYVECEVVSRMDSGDHWITYMKVTGGGVSKKDAETAVHHRKLATYY